MHYKQNIGSNSSTKSKSFISRKSSNMISKQQNYKQRANVLFEKLNSFKTNLQNQKHQQFSQVINQIHQLQFTLNKNSTQKQQHYEQVISSLAQINKQLTHNRTQYERFNKTLDNIIQNTNRQCQIILNKMQRQKSNNQNSIQKYIDFKIESFILKNKGVWLEQDLLNFQPYKEQLNYLKKQINLFYKCQTRETEKLKKQVSDSLQKQKQFLLQEINKSDHQDLMTAIQTIYCQIKKKVTTLTENRSNVEHHVLEMIENVVNSYIRDSNKFK